jgi:hypothetical protein
MFERSGTSWVSRGILGPGVLAVSKAEFGYGVALSGNGRRLAVIQSNLIHIFEQASDGGYDQIVVREPDPNKSGIWDVDLSEDGENLIVGLPAMANGTSSIMIYRHSDGAWTKVQEKSGTNIGIGWKVAISQSAAIASSINFVSNGDHLSKLYAFGNDMDAVGNWITGDPQTTLGVQASDVGVSIDGPWVFAAFANVGALPAVKIYRIDTGIPSPVPGDLNGDLYTDLLWRHPNGRTVAWLMNGINLQSTATLLDSESSWEIVGTGDFNRDKKVDLLWRDPEGRLMIWLMNGTTLLQAKWIFPNPTSWRVAGTGDFNEDGFTDVVWQDVDGRVLVWYMNGTTMVTPHYIATAATDWVVTGIADFNQDNHPDLVWQHPSGTALLWVMTGVGLVQAQSLLASDTLWRIVGARDLDRDGNPDLIWQYPEGQALMWLMNGTSLRVAASLRNDQTVWKLSAR